MGASEAKATFLDMKRILDKSLVKFWIVDGIALGAVREGKFIEGDLDIDLRVLASDWDPGVMEDVFKKEGFVYYQSVNKALYGNLPVGAVVIKRGIKTDICLGYIYPPTKRIVVLASKPLSNVSVLPASLFSKDEDCFVEFLGRRVRVPNPPEKYLKTRYGKGWKTLKNEKFPEICKPISLTKYVEYFHRCPEINQKRAE